MQHLIFLGPLDAALTRGVQSIDEAVDEARLLHLAFRGLLVIPVLIVVKLRPVLPKTRLVHNFIAAQLVAECAWFIVGKVSTIVEVNVAVSARSIGRSLRHVISSTK